MDRWTALEVNDQLVQGCSTNFRQIYGKFQTNTRCKKFNYKKSLCNLLKKNFQRIFNRSWLNRQLINLRPATRKENFRDRSQAPREGSEIQIPLYYPMYNMWRRKSVAQKKCVDLSPCSKNLEYFNIFPLVSLNPLVQASRFENTLESVTPRNDFHHFYSLFNF